MLEACDFIQLYTDAEVSEEKKADHKLNFFFLKKRKVKGVFRKRF